MSDETKKDEQIPEVKAASSEETLSESELEQVAGGGKAKQAPSKQEYLIIKMNDIIVT